MKPRWAARAWRLRRLAVRASPVLALGIVYLSSVNYVDSYEVGIAWDRAAGTCVLQGPGVHWTAPWVSVSCVDTRPQRVCVSTTGKGFSCKLVAFVPGAYREFVAVEGHRYYWLSNRVSFNLGYDEEYRGMKDLLRGYAYGATAYPFVVTLRDLSAP